MRGRKLGGNAVALYVCGLVLLTLPRIASAQASTGYEMALTGRLDAIYGESFRVSGTAYEVLGLATLRALGGGEVTGKLLEYRDERWVEVARNVAVADRSGRFELAILVPLRDMASPRLEITVGRRGGTSRTFEHALSMRSPFTIMALLDRAHILSQHDPVAAYPKPRSRSPCDNTMKERKSVPVTEFGIGRRTAKCRELSLHQHLPFRRSVCRHRTIRIASRGYRSVSGRSNGYECIRRLDP